MITEHPTENTKKRTMVQLRWVLMPFVIIIVAVVILGVLSAMAPKPAKKPAEQKAPLVEVISLNQHSVTFMVETQGNVQPRTETMLISEVSGIVKFVAENFVVGGYFKQGELILEIDPINYQVALLQAQARLDGAKAKLVEETARSAQAEKEWLMSGRPLAEAPILALRTPQLQQVQADVKAAEADVKNAQNKLANTKIKAPYAAMIKEKMVDIGQYVSAGTQLAKSFAVDYAEVRLPIKEQDLSYLLLPTINGEGREISQVKLMRHIAGKTEHWAGQLTRSEGVVDSTSRVDYIIAKIDDPYRLNDASGAALKMGTFVNAEISGITLDDIVTIPRVAVRGSNSVYLLSADNKLVIQSFDILRSDRENVYSRESALANANVIITNIQTPIAGMQLRKNSDEKSNDTELIDADKSSVEGAL